MTLPEMLNRRSCDSCTVDDCTDCGASHGRRATDNCSSHEGLEEARKVSEMFRSNMIVGLKVCAFFLLAFMGWIASSNYLTAKDLNEQSQVFKAEVKAVQAEHKELVKISMDHMKDQVDSMVKAVTRMEASVQILVETSEFERKRAEEERERNRVRIEQLERGQLHNRPGNGD
jgi:uncharacterized protein YoxC